MNVETIRDALAATLTNGIVAAVNVYPHPIAAMVTPCIAVEPGEGKYITYHDTWARHGVVKVRYRLALYAGGRTEDAQRLLDQLLSWGAGCPSSIVNAIADDITLGGTVAKVHVVDCDGPSTDVDGSDAAVLIDIYPIPEA